jgi:DNA-binding CsgD family transcriptional regulator
MTIDIARWDVAAGKACRTDEPEAADSATMMEVYRYAVRHGVLLADGLDLAAVRLGLNVHQVFAAVARLVDLRLLRGGPEGDLRPVDPGEASALLVSPIERELYRQRDLADRLRESIETIAGPAGAVDGLEGMAEIRGALKAAGGQCLRELAVLRPVSDQDPVVDELVDSWCGTLAEDVTERIICPHRARADYASRARVGRLVDRGAQVRTVTWLAQTAVFFDRSLAVLIDPGDEAEREPSARRVRDQSVVELLTDMFDRLWDGAVPYAADEAGYDAFVADDLQQSIMQLMAQGLTDEAVARRLGMSVRTCRRHIAALMRNLNSKSRFQAGVHAAQSLVPEAAA